MTPAGSPETPVFRRIMVMWCAVVVVASVWSFGLARHSFSAHAFDGPGSYVYYDEGTGALMPLLIERGKAPYRDFEPRFTPLGYYWYALGYKFFGIDLYSVRLMLSLWNVIAIAIAFWCARFAGAGRWSWLVVLAGLMWGTTEYAVPTPRWLAVPVGMLAVACLGRRGLPSLRRATGAGVLLGLTCLLTQNTGIAASAATVWALAFLAVTGAPVPEHRFSALSLPVVAAAIASIVLARVVWPGNASPEWWLMAGPGFAITLAIGEIGRARRSVDWRLSVALATRVVVLTIAQVGTIALGFAYWINQSGWEPVKRSLVAGATSLGSVYYLPPSAPPVQFAIVLLLWLLVCVWLRRRGNGPHTWWQSSLLMFVAALGLWAMWWRLVPEKSFVEGLWYVSTRLILDTLPQLMWVIAVALAGWGLWRARDPEYLHERPTVAAIAMAFAAIAAWMHMYPWGDYVHALWVAPPAAVALAAACARGWPWLAHKTQLESMGSLRRTVVAMAFAAAPATVVLAMLVKWGGYWFVYTDSIRLDHPVARQWGMLDADSGRIAIERSVADAWQGMANHVRTNTSATDPVLGLPHFFTINIVADRPFPIYDPFWWPDFEGAERQRQEAELIAALESGDVPLVVGSVSDETYFSLPVMQETWPGAWAALRKHYRRTAEYGPYWVFELRHPPASANTP